MRKKSTDVFMELLRREVVPALGCTEPVAVALATALAVRDLGREPERIEVKVSGNLYKNGMGVMVPGTGGAGLDIAAAAGALAGDPDAGLEVLRNVTPEVAARAALMLERDEVRVSLADTKKTLYAESRVTSGKDWARTVLEDGHTNVVLREKNGKELFRADPAQSSALAGGDGEWPLSLAAIRAYADKPPREAVAFVLESAKCNSKAAEEGLRGEFGLQVGRNMKPCEILGDDAASFAVRFTAAGSDFRMAGGMLPVMSNSGSGNQGLACTLPIVAIARRIGADDKALARALLVSHLTAIHIKHFVGKLSALCGAITASTGAACGLVCLLGGDVAAMGRAVRNMAGDLAGMVCDGAKFTCALKVATTTSAAVRAAQLALHNHAPEGDNGIVDDDPEKTIGYLAQLAQQGMMETDKVVLDIMVEKKDRRDKEKTAASARLKKRATTKE